MAERVATPGPTVAVAPARPLRTAVILQPTYLPWLGFFAQLHRSDVFVAYDDVQYSKQSWQSRNRIKTATGASWLTVPTLKHGRHGQFIRDTEIDNTSRWQTKHLRSLEQHYRRAPYFAEYMPRLATLYDRRWRFLLDLNLTALGVVSEALGIRREIRLASELDIPGTGMERLVAMCHALGANAYYNGAAGRGRYLPDYFAERGVWLDFQDYRHPVYAQRYGEFVPYLSVVDLLFNCGPASLQFLLSGDTASASHSQAFSTSASLQAA